MPCYTASDRVHTFSTSPHKTPLQHQTSHSTGLVEGSPTLRHGLLVVRCRRTLPGSMRPRPRCTSAHPRSIKNHDSVSDRCTREITRRLNFADVFVEHVRRCNRRNCLSNRECVCACEGYQYDLIDLINLLYYSRKNYRINVTTYLVIVITTVIILSVSDNK